MELTEQQATTYEQIKARYIEAINTSYDEFDTHLSVADLYAPECQVLHIIDLRGYIDVWLLTLGLGDEGGPAFIDCHVRDNQVIFLATHFDTASWEMFRLDYANNQPVWFGKQEAR